MSPSVSEVVRDASMLLHEIDPAQRLLVFRQASEQSIRSAAFIDGRTDIWAGPPIALPFSAAAEATTRPAFAVRYIFHMSFCGSTLLARLLDRPGKVLSLKEPNCLVDLADWRAAFSSANASSSDFNAILPFAARMLSRVWSNDEQVVVKPSSWANNLIGDLLAAADARAVFVTIARDRFLEAVLRGGRDRLTFTARLAAHLSSSVDGGSDLVEQAIQSTDDPVGKAARLALVAHHLELQAFGHAMVPEPEGARVDFAEIESEPANAASRAAEILFLNLDQSDFDANCERWMRENAKADAVYSERQRRTENEQVRAHFGELIDGALKWSEGALCAGE